MRQLLRSRSAWLLIAVVALFAFLPAQWLMERPAPAALPDKPPAQADYYLRDAEIDVMDENGQLSYRLRTAELLRLNDRSSRLSKVQIESLGGSPGIWRLEAGLATISQNQELLQLSGGVNMQTQGAHGTTRLSTENLRVELKNHRMTTAEPVLIEGPTYTARAVGLQANTRSRNLILMNNVRTRHAP